VVAGRQPSVDRIARQELRPRICAANTGSPRAPTNGGKCSTTARSDQRGVRQDFIRPLQAGTGRTPGELQWTTAKPVLAPQLAQQSERCTAQDRSLETGYQPGACGSFAGRVCTKRSEDEDMNGQVFESDGWGKGTQTPTRCPAPPARAHVSCPGIVGDAGLDANYRR
jgi:hypothetical protein